MAIGENLITIKMKKKFIFSATLIMGLLVIVQPPLNAQEKNKKVIERPSKCDVKDVDVFVSKTFDAYDESRKITEDVKLIKVEGDGIKTPSSIKNAKGEELSKEAALIQLGDLLKRAKNQNDNIKTLQDLQKPATESLKKCSMTQKPKAGKSLAKGGEALNEVVKQTKTQIESIEKQITDIKAIKVSK